MLKHVEEYPSLVHLGRHNGLTVEQVVLLLALREMINGEKGFEFGEFSMKGSDLENQALCTINRIKDATQQYQDYCRNRREMDPIPFLEFFGLDINIDSYIKQVEGNFGGETDES